MLRRWDIDRSLYKNKSQRGERNVHLSVMCFQFNMSNVTKKGGMGCRDFWNNDGLLHDSFLEKGGMRTGAGVQKWSVK
ncbi:hypothetical protein POVWA1_005870 [Plasmodium ovale wallikeri]|uniref:Uncharacterized protein n=1 Tax=Plasmodium ovale wallikeri TaxID=864142 RepID=A0A1A8YI20_PLAOA|nr:hypothetical protein POVWA1_005870 [Plasmodium ovale wallikeri]